MINGRKQVRNSFLSLVSAFLASSHHWLHMGLLMLLGGSTNMMATMNTVIWIRRFMIAATLFIVIFSIYRLVKHRCKDKKIISITILSVILSVFFIANTLIQYGW